MPPPDRRRPGLFAVWLVGTALAGLAAAAPANEPAPGITCFPDRSVARPGETMVLRAFVTPPRVPAPAAAAPLAWRVSAGTVKGTDPAFWTLGADALRGDRLRETTATVTAGTYAGAPPPCRLRVTLAAPPPVSAPSGTGSNPDRGGRLSARALLLQDQDVPAGYGLVSYLLLATPPQSAAERERALEAIGAWLRQLPRREELEHFRPPSQINLTVLPVRQAVNLPEPSADERIASQAAQRLLEVYDFARAQHLLDTFGQDVRAAGAYLVAQPAGSAETTLAFDMSRAAPRLVGDWVAAYCALAAQERSWGQVTLRKLSLHARNFLAVAARDAPEVVEEMGQWVKLSTPSQAR